MAFMPPSIFEKTTVKPLYQAVTDRDGTIQFFEILARVSDEKGKVTPTQPFIESLEGRGKDTMLKFDTLMLQHATKALTDNPHVDLSLNISALTLCHPAWSGVVRSTFKRNPDLMERLAFEITETKPIADMGQAKAFCTDIHRRGGKIYLDDCGDGHLIAVTTAVKALKPDALKVSAVIARDMHKSPVNRAAFDVFRTLAEELTIPVVVEGIQNQKQLKHAQKIRSDSDILLQGNLISAPNTSLPKRSAARPRAVPRSQLQRKRL